MQVTQDSSTTAHSASQESLNFIIFEMFYSIATWLPKNQSYWLRHYWHQALVQAHRRTKSVPIAQACGDIM